MTTIDTAIAAWKGATTQADRDLAAVAIEEHIAHETPESGDYEYATRELIDRLKAECGPVPPPEDGVYEDEACTQPIDDEARLPSIFYLHSAGTITRYWYTQPHTYDSHELRVRGDEKIWLGQGSETIDDDTTAEEFLAGQG